MSSSQSCAVEIVLDVAVLLETMSGLKSHLNVLHQADYSFNKNLAHNYHYALLLQKVSESNSNFVHVLLHSHRIPIHTFKYKVRKEKNRNNTNELQRTMTSCLFVCFKSEGSK